ncbi:histidine kinase [Rhodotorula toruloides]|uniref:Histidine kinase n=1 Tax=Rhodotorula toruloides TaxID=5286 RepID=A0A511KJ00_RHOTO|nr:histidine kinase [Rhodotorula toruloides]
MLHTAQSGARGVHAFGLPIVALSVESLSLSECNGPAKRLLELHDGNDGFTGVDLLRGPVQEQRDGGKRVREGLKEFLIGLARRSSALPWGEILQLDFLTRTGQRRRADVVVTFSSTDSSASASTDDDVTLSILFVRPLPVDSASLWSPSLSNLQRSGAHTSAMPSSPPSPRPSSDSFSPPPNHAFPFPPHVDATTNPSSDRSASFSSSNSRPPRRIAVGDERAKLPLDDHLKTLLQHATIRVTGPVSTPRTTSVSPDLDSPLTPPTSAAPSIPSPPVPSTNIVAASPVLSSDSPKHSSNTSHPSAPRRTPSGSKLPASVEGLTGRRQSFDQALDTLSQKTDGTARADGSGPTFFRLPVNEIDAGSTDLSPQSEKDNPLAGLGPSSGSSNDDFSQATPAEDAALLETAREEAAEKRARDVRPPLSLAQLTNMVEHNPHMCFIADTDGQVVWLNSTWYEYTGGDPRYHMDFAEWMSMFHPDDLSAVLPIYLGAMQSGEPFSFEYRIKNKDGRLRWHKASGRPQKGADGKPVAWYATIADVEPEIRARHDALLVKERTRAVLEGSDLTLLTVDPSFRITFFEGKTPPRLTGRCHDAIVGSPLQEFFPAEELHEAIQKVLDGESENGFAESEKATRQGTLYYRYRLVPLRGDPSIPQFHPDYNAITGCIIVCADLAASEVAAREANQLKTSFLTTISHEIRTPIAAILGICELLLADSDRLAPDQRNLVENAVQSGELLLELVGAVLDVRKIETGELELETAPFLLCEALADARLFAIIAQKKGLDFVEDVGDFYGGTLLADRLRLRQVLANALSNAVKFTKDGSVTLQCRQLSEDDTRIVVRFEIVDTGVGIDSTVLPTLFHPFRQADASTAREYGGSGLGLTIAKKLVELMGGSIRLESTLGQGSRMTITIPLQKAPFVDVVDFGTPLSLPAETPAEAKRLAQSEEVVKKARKSRRPEDVRILLAEDNELIREIVTRTLRKKRFVVDAVVDGRQCVEQVQRERYDCVLMDGQMPGLDGYHASQLIRQSPDLSIRRLRIIALTASAIAGDRERCLGAGMNAYLAKPVRAAELEAAIWEQVELAEDERDAWNGVDL